MQYTLRNGEILNIRKPTVDDADALVYLMKTADNETKFLARESDEFITTPEQEREIIVARLQEEDAAWFVAEYKGKIVGECSTGLVRTRKRFRHRAECSFIVLKDFWGLGIGGKLMQECMNWARNRGCLQIELEVVSTNERAINMYKSFGFEITGTFPNAFRYADGTFVDNHFMVCKL